MRSRQLLPVFCLALLLCTAGTASAQECSADCTHATKACVCAIDPEPKGLIVTPVGGIERHELQLRRALSAGDEIMSVNENAVVGLTCPGGSDVKLHGRFRAVIMPAVPGQDCALNLLAGNADVQTTQPTELTAGETVMGSKRTLYSMRVVKETEGARVECLVFEGEAHVRQLSAGKVRPLTTGTKASWWDGRLAQPPTTVSERDILRASVVFARADVARARALGGPVENPDALRRALQESYAAVLTRPADPAPRIHLASLQTRAEIPAQALYQLNKAESLNPTQVDQRAAIAAGKWEVYRKTGREQEAAIQSEKLRAIDPDRYKRIVKAPGVLDSRSSVPQGEAKSTVQPAATKPAVSNPALLGTVALPRIIVTAAATPAAARPGQAVTIVVTAKTRDGKPIAGAKVVVAAGGGTFRTTGRLQAEGQTDVNGTFTTYWLCQTCAPTYQLTADVTAPGLPTATTSVDVTIR